MLLHSVNPFFVYCPLVLSVKKEGGVDLDSYVFFLVEEVVTSGSIPAYQRRGKEDGSH